MPATKPKAEDYLEDGKRLVRVLSYFADDDCLVEDAITGQAETLKSLRDWRKVERVPDGE